MKILSVLVLILTCYGLSFSQSNRLSTSVTDMYYSMQNDNEYNRLAFQLAYERKVTSHASLILSWRHLQKNETIIFQVSQMNNFTMTARTYSREDMSGWFVGIQATYINGTLKDNALPNEPSSLIEGYDVGIEGGYLYEYKRFSIEALMTMNYQKIDYGSHSNFIYKTQRLSSNIDSTLIKVRLGYRF